MGICFEVDNLLGSRELVHPRFRVAKTRVDWQTERRAVILAICQHFGWKWTPWEEPSERHGTEGNCCSKSRYDWLRALAIAIATDDATSTAEELIAPNIVANRFRHLTNRNDSQYTAVYIPTDFEQPFQIDTAQWETCTIASSVGLIRELRELYPLLQLEQRKQDKFVSRYSEEKWQYLYELHGEILACAENSVSVNLPMLLTW
jgi:hypothetical protein